MRHSAALVVGNVSAITAPHLAICDFIKVYSFGPWVPTPLCSHPGMAGLSHSLPVNTQNTSQTQ